MDLEAGEYYYISVIDGNKLIQSGKIEKIDDNCYALYEGNTDSLYGKIIPSYEKIYLIDKSFEIKPHYRFLDILIKPNP